MKIFRHYILLLSCLSISYVAIGQVDLFPIHFGQVGLVKSILNPALQNVDAANTFVFCNQFYTGAFSKFDNLFFQGSVGLNKSDSAAYKHFVGLKFTNEIEGDYIDRPRYFVSYAWHTQLTERYRVGAGLNIGRSSYRYKGTNVSSLGSDSNWDGDFGLSLYSEQNVLAFSCNQLFNSKIIPKEMYFRWARYYTVFVQKTFQISKASSFSVFVQNQFLPNQFDKTDVGIQLISNNLLIVGGNMYFKQSLSFLTGLKDISIDKHHFSVFTSYTVPFSKQSNANVQSYELALVYTIK